VLGVGGFELGLVDGHGVVERAGEVGLGGHAVVDGDDPVVAEAGHEDGFGGAGFAGEELVAAAVDVDEGLVAVLGGDDIGGDDEGADTVDGGGLDGDVETLAHGRQGLHGDGGLLVGEGAPLVAGLHEIVPVGVTRRGDELLQLGADVGGDGKRLGGDLLGAGCVVALG
jgi:hypothetical protein